VLELGVTADARWEPGDRNAVRITADVPGPLPISEEVARRLVPPNSGRVTVRLTHQMPVGQGFGMSAAGALSTAFAVATIFGIPRQRAIEVAHLTELFGGGGLGGVAAILGGGLEYRVRAGVPPRGQVVHRSFPPVLFVGVVGGPIPSPRVLSDARLLRRIARAANEAWREKRAPRVSEFLDASQRFTDRAGIVSPPLGRVLRAIRSEGGWAAQAMFGNSFFAVPRTPTRRRGILRVLQQHGIPTVELSARRAGAARRRGSG
jgi:pantoate kinase